MTAEPQELKLTPTAFRKGNVETDPDAELASQIFVLDMQEAMPNIRRLRDWALDVLAPRAGERAVDVGCGAGTEVRRLAELVGPGGEAIGVEPHPGLRAEAERRAITAGAGATFIDGDAVALPFEEGSVDVLRCERVFQHLPDPDAAAREFARVVAPGGRVVVLDTDWGTQIMSVGDPDVVRRINSASWQRFTNPFSGRSLRGQLHRAGLAVDPDIVGMAVVLPDEVVRGMQLLRISIASALAEGVVSADEAAQLEREIPAAVDAGEAFLAVTMFGVLARRP